MATQNPFGNGSGADRLPDPPPAPESALAELERRFEAKLAEFKKEMCADVQMQVLELNSKIVALTPVASEKSFELVEDDIDAKIANAIQEAEDKASGKFANHILKLQTATDEKAKLVSKLQEKLEAQNTEHLSHIQNIKAQFNAQTIHSASTTEKAPKFVFNKNYKLTDNEKWTDTNPYQFKMFKTKIMNYFGSCEYPLTPVLEYAAKQKVKIDIEEISADGKRVHEELLQDHPNLGEMDRMLLSEVLNLRRSRLRHGGAELHWQGG